jgi:hypothetical protein
LSDSGNDLFHIKKSFIYNILILVQWQWYFAGVWIWVRPGAKITRHLPALHLKKVAQSR